MPKKMKGGENFYIALGDAIRRRRQKLNISLDALGRQIGGLTRATISGIEKGRQQIGAYQLYKFALALKLSVGDLISEAAKEAENPKKTLDQISFKPAKDNSNDNFQNIESL
jgi:transcriptional regulator with XRE-family HTH domain